MSCGIDASGKAGRDQVTCFSQTIGEDAGHLAAIGGGCARTNDANRFPDCQMEISRHAENWRGTVDFGKGWRIVRFAHGHEL